MPEWQFTCEIPVLAMSDTIRLIVYDEDLMSNDLIGEHLG
jgi:hypothetical protein